MKCSGIESGDGCTALRYPKIHWIIYCKKVNFMIHELCISNLKSDDAKIIFDDDINLILTCSRLCRWLLNNLTLSAFFSVYL